MNAVKVEQVSPKFCFDPTYSQDVAWKDPFPIFKAGCPNEARQALCPNCKRFKVLYSGCTGKSLTVDCPVCEVQFQIIDQ